MTQHPPSNGPSRLDTQLAYWRAEVNRCKHGRDTATDAVEYNNYEYMLEIARAAVQRLEMEAWNI